MFANITLHTANLLIAFFKTSTNIPKVIKDIINVSNDQIDKIETQRYNIVIKHELCKQTNNYAELKQDLFIQICNQICCEVFIHLYIPLELNTSMDSYINSVFKTYDVQCKIINEITNICKYHPSAEMTYCNNYVTSFDKILQTTSIIYDFNSEDEYQNIQILILSRLKKILDDLKNIIAGCDYMMLAVKQIVNYNIILNNIHNFIRNEYNAQNDEKSYIDSKYHVWGDIFKSQWILNTPEYSKLNIDECVDYCSILHFLVNDYHSTLQQLLQMISNYKTELLLQNDNTLQENKDYILQYITKIEHLSVLLINKVNDYSSLILKGAVNKELTNGINTSTKIDANNESEFMKYKFPNLSKAIEQDEIVFLNNYHKCLQFINPHKKILLTHNYPDMCISLFINKSTNQVETEVVCNKNIKIINPSESICKNSNINEVNDTIQIINSCIDKHVTPNIVTKCLKKKEYVKEELKELNNNLLNIIITPTHKADEVAHQTQGIKLNNVNNTNKTMKKVIINNTNLKNEQLNLNKLNDKLNDSILKVSNEFMNVTKCNVKK